jgi:hypothetical protein
LNVAADGSRSVTSDFNNPDLGVLGEYAEGLAVTSSGAVLVIDSEAGTSEEGLLYSVDTTTGARTTITDFSDASQGALGGDPFGIVLQTGLLGLGDTPVVIDNDAGTDGIGVLFSVNTSTGQRTVLSDLGDPSQGPVGVEPTAIAFSPGLAGITDAILVLDDEAGTDGAGALFSVDPSSGQRSLLIDFGDASKGPVGQAVAGIAVR